MTTVKGELIAQVNVHGEVGLPDEALITLSDLFPRSLEDDFKNIFTGLAVRIKYDQIVVIK